MQSLIRTVAQVVPKVLRTHSNETDNRPKSRKVNNVRELKAALPQAT